MAKANPAILIWARESSGLTLEEASGKLGLGGKRLSGPDMLAAFESGERSPTQKQLMNIAKLYHRPLITFFLLTPPKSANLGEDFRLLPEAKRDENEGRVRALIRDIHIRQSLVKEALIDSEEDEEIPFVGAGNSMPSIISAKEIIKEHFQIETEKFRRKPNPHEAFNYLRKKVEKTGIYVLLIGDLGSHHSSISTEAFRGFALSDPIAPFIVINQNDAKSAWSFTLLHEIIHLWIGKTGISSQNHEHAIERYCNDIASNILISGEEIENIKRKIEERDDSLITTLQYEANHFNVSASLIAYRLFRNNHLTLQEWKKTSNELQDLWRTSKSLSKEKESGKSGNFYNTQRHRAGGALISLVRRSLHEGTLTETKAGKVLGVSPGNVSEMVGL